MTYIPAIDGARAVAILIVIASHFGLGFVVPGNFGVTLFFFISGFLITRLLFLEAQQYGSVSICHFYIRRFLRLSPALMMMLLIVSISFYFFSTTINWDQTFAGIFYYTNYFIISGGTQTMPVVPLWSLAVEEHYYIVFPAIFVLLFQSKSRFLICLALAAGACLVWRIALVYGMHVSEARTHIATDARIDSILYGAVLAVIVEMVGRVDLFNNRYVIAASALLLCSTFLVRNSGFRETLRYSLQGIALLPIFYALVFGESSVSRRILEAPIMIWIGKLSYSLYLWHEAVLYFARHFFSGWFAYPLALLLSFGAAGLSYYFVETPFRKLRRHFHQRRRLAATAAALTSALIAISSIYPLKSAAATPNSSASCDTADDFVTTTPAPPIAADRVRLYQKQLASVTPGNVDILLIGDSLAEYWNVKAFLPWRAFNMGIGPDQTQHVLWRMMSPEWAKIKPRKVLIILGNNNIYRGDKPCAIVLGLTKVIERARELWPPAEIIFLEITPRGKDFLSNDQARREVNAAMAQMPNITSVNIDDQITCGWKMPCDNYSSDFVHFTASGYEVIFRALRPTLSPHYP